jgi:glycerate 2-kinase
MVGNNVYFQLMNILIAPNSMKGSLSAKRFAEIIKKAFCETNHGFFKTRMMSVADGGDGTAEILIDSLKLKRIPIKADGPLGREIMATFGFSGGIAVIEMADVSGMKLLAKEELNPLKASSFGTGQLILEASRLGARKIYLGVGGSATVDGGMGMLEALGAKFFDFEGNILHGNGANLAKIHSIDTSGLNLPEGIEIKIISDVDNPLLGENGAARVFAPQKGATPEMVGQLERGLANFEEKVRLKTGVSTSNLKGSGAAGGIAVGLVAFFNAGIVSGADFVLNILDFNKQLDWADVVVTGEGKFDRQSLQDKAPYVVACRANNAGKPVYAIAGVNDFPDQTVFEKVLPLVSAKIKTEEAIKNVEKLVCEKANELAKILSRQSFSR